MSDSAIEAVERERAEWGAARRAGVPGDAYYAYRAARLAEGDES